MSLWLERAFSFFFKYRPAVFAQGDLAFGVSRGVIVAIVLMALIVAPAIISYRTVRGKSTRRDRMILGALRGAALVVLLLCLFRPMLLLSAAVPQRNFVGVLIDDSRSMRIADDQGYARSDFVKRSFGGADSSLLAELRKRFQVRLFRFGSSATRVDDIAGLTYAAEETHVGDAIEQARQALDAVPLSGLVVLTDGADNSASPVADELLSLRARSVPVFTVGLGAERFDKDIEIRRVDAPRSMLQGSAFVADLLIRQRGYGAITVPLVVEDNGRMIARDTIRLPGNGTVAPVRVHVVARDAGARTITFRIPVQSGELIPQNNTRDALVDVRRRRDKILYMEGEPRYEVRFLREAIEADSNLQLVVLLRTADNKYLRLSVDSPDELAGGFPRTRGELFGYRGIVLGSMEASYFSRDQLQMLADFVSIRGGGMLFLGGRNSFAEGGFEGTPLADVMPVTLGEGSPADSFFTELKVDATPAGASDAVTQQAMVAGTEHAQDKSPIVTVPVTTVNRIAGAKPGAVTLLSGSAVANAASGMAKGAKGYTQPVLVYQRYGRGLSVALPVQDPWLWQMHAVVPPGDLTHQTFWRQTLRWLTADTPGRVRVQVASDQVNPRTPIAVRAEVVDSTYVPLNDAAVVAHVKSPSGMVRDVPLDWAVDREGEYRASFTPDEQGVYAIHVAATNARGITAGDSAFVRVADMNAEFIDAEMRAPLLKRIADETGGKFYTPATVGTLPDDLTMSKRGVTVVNEMDLWDMPVIFMLLVGLVSAEWAYRKARGLI